MSSKNTSLQSIRAIDLLFKKTDHINIKMVQLALDIPKEQEAADILGAYFQRYKKKKIGVFSLTLKQDGQLVRRIITSETTERFEKDQVASCILIGIKNKKKKTSATKMVNAEEEAPPTAEKYSDYGMIASSKQEEQRLKDLTKESSEGSNAKRNLTKVNRIERVNKYHKATKKFKPNTGSSQNSAASNNRSKASGASIRDMLGANRSKKSETSNSSSKKTKKNTSILNFFGKKKGDK